MACDEAIRLRLDAWLDGALEGAAAARVAAHAASCPRCAARVEASRELKASVAALPRHQAAPSDLARVLDAVRSGWDIRGVAARDGASDATAGDALPRDVATSGAVRSGVGDSGEPPRQEAGSRGRPRPSAGLGWARLAAATLLAATAGGLATLSQSPSASLAWAPGLFAAFEAPDEPPASPLRPLPPPPPDLAGMGGEAPRLSPAARASLAANGIVLRRDPDVLAGGFLAVYEGGPERGAEVELLTADLAYAALAQALADAQRALEVEVLGPELERLLEALDLRLAADARATSSAGIRDALDRARAIVGVARALLAGAEAPLAARGGVDDRVAADLALCAAGRGIAASRCYGEPFDFAGLVEDRGRPQDRVRRALRWLAHGGVGLDRAQGRRVAVALCWALAAAAEGNARALARYERVRSALDFFHGELDGPDAAWALARLAAQQGGVLRLPDGDAELDRLAAALDRAPAPRIPGPAGVRPLFALFGARYGFEAAASTRLAWPHAGTPAAPRLAVSGLDALAAEGFAGARAWLLEDPAAADGRLAAALASLYEEARRRAGLGGVAAGPRDDLYWLLAHARAGLGGTSWRGPTEGAQARQLALGLASLDPLAVEPGGASPPSGSPASAGAEGGRVTATAVEPEPRWFARLAAIARAAARGLEDAAPGPAATESAPHGERAMGEGDSSSQAVARRLRALAATLDAASAAARAALDGAARGGAGRDDLGAGAARDLARAHLPGPFAAVTVLGVIDRPGRAPAYRLRIVRGPVEVLALVPHPRDEGRVVVARGAGVEVFELTSERRLEPAGALALPSLPPPWGRTLWTE